MKNRISFYVFLFSVVIFLTSCASGPKNIEGLESSSKLQTSADFQNTLVYKKEGVNGKKYVRFNFKPVVIYDGADAQFHDVSDEDKKIIADFIKNEFIKVIKDKYQVVDEIAPDVLHIKFTLVGIELTKPALATMTRVTPVGLALNLGKSASGMQGSFMGSVTFAAEFYDSETNNLVYSFLTKRGPNAMDVTTMITGLDAAKKAVTEIAAKFRETIDMLQKK